MKQFNITVMKTIKFESFIAEECAVTTGNFDGVHKGHGKILDTLNSIAINNRYKRILITFERHPRLFFNPDLAHYVLSPHAEKTLLLEDAIDYIIPIQFNNDFASLKPEAYMKHLVKHFNMKHYIAGYDHHIGRDKNGSFENLSLIATKHNFKLDRVPPILYINDPISSSRIKEALDNGRVETAAEMLGRYFSLEGVVIHGKQIGRTIGFPTANIKLPYDKYIPPLGVYAAFVWYEGLRYNAMLNIGTNPTVSNEQELSVEAHILDFNSSLYDSNIKIELVSKIRDEIIFANFEELKEQISRDKTEICNRLSKETEE